MTLDLPVSIKFKIGEHLKQGIGEKRIGKYLLLPLPSEISDEFKSELLLTFEDKWVDKQNGSNPIREAEIILAWLSLILRQKIKIVSSRLNNVQIQARVNELVAFDSPTFFPEDLLDLYNKFKSISPNELLEKYVRACECYQESLLISASNPSISFLLLVVCIECLSSKDDNFYEYLIKNFPENEKITKNHIIQLNERFLEESGLAKNFVKFIMFHFDDWRKNFSEDEFKNLLSSIYKIRSSFAHTGENISKYMKFVDLTLKSKSVFTRIGNIDLEFPGLNYFSSMVREVLVNFLKKQNNPEKDNIPNLALKHSIMDLKTNEPLTVNEGDIITIDKIKHRN